MPGADLAVDTLFINHFIGGHKMFPENDAKFEETTIKVVKVDSSADQTLAGQSKTIVIEEVDTEAEI